MDSDAFEAMLYTKDTVLRWQHFSIFVHAVPGDHRWTLAGPTHRPIEI